MDCSYFNQTGLSGPKLIRAVFIIALFTLSAVFPLQAQVKNFPIDASRLIDKVPVTLDKMGGKSASGEVIKVNNQYIEKGGVPIIPITGEFHFSRYPRQYWDESIKKMKAGGINMIATYVFWSLHEEKEGKFVWDGDRDLRKFIQLCAKNNIDVVVRIGPFCHGEIRNGGIPDWILGKPLNIRENDPLYLHYVERLYNEIGNQLSGLFYKDGGPIVAVQLENEYQHSASPWGLTYPGQPYDFTTAERDINSAHEGVSVASKDNPYASLGNDHMRALKALAIKAGIVPPLYTATGWGYAAIIPDETLPVTAAYAYPTWVPKRELSPFYLYKDLHSSPDYAPVRYKPLDYPAFAAELGSGIMSTYTRRPIVPAESMDALINRCLGGGANGIGYYMYHGGSTPAGEHYFFNDEAYGYPKISYDFQAPIGEYGQIRPSFHRLKLLHNFINDFAAELAPMFTILPDNSARIKPDNVADLRYALRMKGNSGFLFINNFQDNTTTIDHNHIRINIQTKGGLINVPESGSFNIKADENLIFPINFNINGVNLNYATAQLLMKGGNVKEPFYVFFSLPGIAPEFCFNKADATFKGIDNCRTEERSGKLWVKCMAGQPAEFMVTGKNGVKTQILVLTRELALKTYTQQIDDSRHLILTDALVLSDHQTAELKSVGKNNFDFAVFPKIKNMPKITHGVISENPSGKIFSAYTIALPAFTVQPAILKTGARKININIPKELPDGVDDLFLNIDYIGDTAMAYLNDDLVADEFYKGIPWEIGLKRFIAEKRSTDLGFYFRPLYRDAPYMADLPKEVAGLAAKSSQTLQVNKVSYVPEYITSIKF